MHRTTITILAAAAAALTAASPAAATTVKLVTGPSGSKQIVYTASPGQHNDMHVLKNGGGGGIIVYEQPYKLKAGVGCTNLDQHAVYCPAGQVKRIRLSLGDGINAANSDAGVSTVFKTTSGNHLPQYFDGSSKRDFLYGGDGDDWLFGQGGPDYVSCSGGFDTVNADATDDVAEDCERVRYPGRTH
jgi:Ca2+-binding RTX toxin-like protein